MAPTTEQAPPRDPGLVAPILSAEEAAIGAAMWSTRAQAAAIVAKLTDDDIRSPAVQLVRRCVAELCDAGITPDPAAVLAHAIARDNVTSAHVIHNLTRTLWTLYDHRAVVPASASYYVAQALEQSWRRRTVEMATRLAQVAGHADPDELDRLSRAELDAVNEIRARHRALVGDGMAA